MPNIKVRLLDYVIGMRIVARDMNMSNVVFLGEMGESFDKGWSIVRDNFNKGAPSIEDVFKDPVGKCCASLIVKHAKLRVM